MRTADLTKQVCHYFNASKNISDQAFLAAMLHDAGKLILAYNFPQKYDALYQTASNDSKRNLLEAEQEIFGGTHSEVGGYLIGLWGLPPQVVEAITHHHNPRICRHEEFTPLTAVHIANVIEHQNNPPPHFKPAQLDVENLTQLGIYEQFEKLQNELKSESIASS